MVPTELDPSLLKSLDFGTVFFQDFKHFTVENKKQLTVSSSDFEIARVFYPFVRILQALGLTPISVIKSGREIYYDFKILSFNCLYCWATAAAVTFYYSIFLQNRVADSDWPLRIFTSSNNAGIGKSESEPENPPGLISMNGVFQIMSPTAALLISLTGRIQFHHLEKFLNEWTLFSKEYNLKYSTLYKMELRDLKMKSRVFYFVIGFLSCSGVAVGSTKSNQDLLVNDAPIMNAILFSFAWMFIGVAWVFNTIITVMSLCTIKMTLRELRYGIESEYKAAPRGVSAREVKSWVRFLSHVREQVLTFQKFASWPELCDLLTSFALVLALLLILLTMGLHGVDYTQARVIPYAILTVLVGLLRLHAKAVIAEKITEEEENIGISVMGMKSKDCKIRLEMKILVDMITTNPIQVHYGNVVVFNRRLLLLMVSQLAAYLVVLIQFKANSG